MYDSKLEASTYQRASQVNPCQAGSYIGSATGWRILKCSCKECSSSKETYYARLYAAWANEPHGTNKRYRSGCKCDLCVTEMRNRARTYSRRHREKASLAKAKNSQRAAPRYLTPKRSHAYMRDKFINLLRQYGNGVTSDTGKAVVWAAFHLEYASRRGILRLLEFFIEDGVVEVIRLSPKKTHALYLTEEYRMGQFLPQNIDKEVKNLPKLEKPWQLYVEPKS